MHFSKVASQIPDFHVLRIDRLANELMSQGKDVIKLNLGKSEVPMQEVVADEVARQIYDRERREIVEAQGLLPLREAIAEDYFEEYGILVDPGHIFINNGTSPFFLMLYQLILDPADAVLLPMPYYPPYFANTYIARVFPDFYPITDEGRIDVDEFEAAFVSGQQKLVMLNSPGNPLGNVIHYGELEAMRDITEERAVFIADEIYSGMVYGDDFCPALSVLPPELTVVLNGFSKIHHMYTRRLGYAIVPEDLVDPMLKFQRHNVVCVDPVTQFAGLVSLLNKKNLAEEVKQELAVYQGRIARAKDILEDTPIKALNPAGSFYLPVDVLDCLSDKYPDSLSLAEALLREKLVAVTPGEDFGVSTIFRVGLTNERMLEGVERIRDFVNSL